MLQSIIEDGEWMRIEKRRTMSIDGCIFIIKLDVAGPQVRMIGILMKAEH
ncbi:hypothetical protein C497_01750 [Halalkalicoccus jeotgali B3]|uniref:Uncharacterized protein n=1 Tax=Halalkalicoccus jeotgali (strain DSM 18796 / CECT 7217 / JCM 14584 / KCTC 4019 / B3) TaxID=795797 RepID=D8JB08_HALJB|nr:hypothetical protein HacjB3_15506 [Halalkalicoccus jeotgali B3]ELY41444.1 hypothetical protein C497_01750 [Halalkalicoccus jeotgali B3]